ncbi:hypothetical protein WDU94_009745, partial [Cyamophila willieti]
NVQKISGFSGFSFYSLLNFSCSRYLLISAFPGESSACRSLFPKFQSTSQFFEMGPKKVTTAAAKEKAQKRKSEAEESPEKAKKSKTDSGKDTNGKSADMNAKLPLHEIDYSCSKKNKLGQEHNLKIASWNVAGLRACVKKECLEYIKKEDADIFCLQETKCDESKLPPEVKNRFPEYKTYWLGGLKAGYAGVGLYSKVKPVKVSYGLGTSEFDSEGRLITAEYEKFYIVAV